MRHRHQAAILTLCASLLHGCGGGGGGGDGGGPPPPAPTVTLAASPTSVTAGQATTLTWSATNASTCSASGGWSGSRATSGSESVGPLTATVTFTLTCTGAGGTGTQSAAVTVTPPAPVVAVSASPEAIVPGESVTLTWSAVDATSCTASDGWTGDRATSGEETIAAVSATTTFTLTCTGAGGSGSGSAAVTAVAPGGGNVLVRGQITFDRVPFKISPLRGLNPAAPVQSPARQVVVEAVAAAGGVVLASTTTSTNGNYALVVAANTDMFVRARAQMLKAGSAPTWNFSVRNNTNGDAMYVLDGSAFNTGAATNTRNLRAAIGWNGVSYTNRAAAPFAILDTVYQSKQLILSANPVAAFAALDLYWSENNRASTAALCPDTGDIGTSFYIGAGAEDDCSPPQPLPSGIYILGAFANGSGDTDEFDQHVIAHEFGHYYEDRFSRSDSIGGSHSGNERLDLRVAFGEGWGNAYSAMSLNNPAYRDSFSGASDDFGFNLENDFQTAEGWYSEFSVGEILFDLFDSTADGPDSVNLGFAPIHSVMTGPQVSTPAFTSIFSFASALRSTNSGAANGLGTLLAGEQINAVANAFGDTETNGGSVPNTIPVYETATFNAPIQFCSRTEAGTTDANKLGNRKFFRLDVASSGPVTITVTGNATGGVAATDPDIYVFRQGALVAFSNGTEPGREMLSQAPLTAGTHVVEIYDFDIDGSASNRCMSASFTGL